VEAAALDSAGAALGSFGLLTFAFIIWILLPVVATVWVFAGATAAWLVVSISLWWGRRYMRRGRLVGNARNVG